MARQSLLDRMRRDVDKAPARPQRLSRVLAVTGDEPQDHVEMNVMQLLERWQIDPRVVPRTKQP